jgi:hypothetical protein
MGKSLLKQLKVRYAKSKTRYKQELLTARNLTKEKNNSNCVLKTNVSFISVYDVILLKCVI